ncbi:MAG: hypothetical protein IJK51_08760 [Bacteroidaceae bacterium]|jgi:hypothetical protein|nr:hypothetical protein [Bacteroidaceae bacterium]
MSNIANSPDVLAAIQQRKRSIKKKLQASRTQMTDNVSYLTGGNIPKTTDRVQKITRLLINGLVLYRGYRLCSGVVSGIHSFFTPSKRRR